MSSLKISREWATPATIGAFALMAVTGVLMFFHLDTGLNKAAHEWFGWAMVAAVAAHGAANWLAFKRYLTGSRKAQVLIGVFVLVLGASFFVQGGGEGASPPVLAMQAVGRAPLRQVAPLAGKSFEQAQAELKAAGITVRDGDQSLHDATGGQRGELGRAVRVLFGAPARP